MFVHVYKDNKRKQEVYLIYVDLYSVRESEKYCGLVDETLLTLMVTWEMCSGGRYDHGT